MTLSRFKINRSIWTRSLLIMAAAIFLQRFGSAITNAARTNFFVDTLQISGEQVLWLEGIREIPGLALMFIAAFTMHFALSRRAAFALLITGIGYALYSTVDSYPMLLVMSIAASTGLHMWMPLNSSLSMNLAGKNNTAETLGKLNAVGAFSAIVGMVILGVVSKITDNLGSALPLRLYYIIGGMLIVLAGALVYFVPKDIGATETKPPKMLLKKRYWLFYVLTFFQGSRKQVLNTFGLLVLVQRYGLEVWHVSALMVASSLINLFGSPVMGKIIDKYGERRMLTIAYTALTLCCLGYALIDNVWILVFLLLTIKLFVLVEMALNTYVYRTAPPEELTPTLSAGISINHITSVGMPLLAGVLLPYIDYEGIFAGTAVLILLSIPFARAMKKREPQAQTVEVATA